MKTAEEKARAKVSWNYVKEKYLKFHHIDEFTENMAIDIDFGYWLANEVISEATRWRDPKEELPEEYLNVFVKVEKRYEWDTNTLYATSMVVNDSFHNKNYNPFECEGYFTSIRGGREKITVIGWRYIE